MKKFLGILVLGLLWCNTSFAEDKKKGFLGIRMQDVTSEMAEALELDRAKGTFVHSFYENSPADKAGIKFGDVILEFDGTEISDMRILPKILAKTYAGKNVIVKIWRNKKIISKKVILGSLESAEEFKLEPVDTVESLKISIRDLNDDDIAKRKLPKNTTGVIITNIYHDSPLMFLSANTVIVELQKQKIKNSYQFFHLVRKLLFFGNKTLYLAIYNSGNQISYAKVKLE